MQSMFKQRLITGITLSAVVGGLCFGANPNQNDLPPNPGHTSRHTLDADNDKLVASFKAFLSRFLAAYKNHEQHWNNDFDLRNSTFDIKKTDSLVSPIIGIVSFDESLRPNDSIHTECTVTFTQEDGKWVVHGSTCVQVMYDGTRTALSEGNGVFIKAAEAAQKDSAATKP